MSHGCISGIPIPRPSTYVDFEATISCYLSFEAHINGIVSTARQSINIFFTGFTTRNLNIMHRAFIARVRPIFQYNSVVRNPCLTCLVDLI